MIITPSFNITCVTSNVVEGFISRGRFRECYFLLINSSIFLAREREFDFLNSVVFSKINPETLKTSSKSMYKLKMKEGLVFDRGCDFIILLDISVHSLLIGQVLILDKQDYTTFFSPRTEETV